MKIVKNLDELTNAQLTVVYNSVSEKQVTKFADHTTAVRRVERALEGKNVVVMMHDQGSITVAPAEEAPLVGDDRLIRILADKNPKRAGTDAAARFALYRDGMTVGEFVKAVMAKGGKRRNAIRDLDWDMSHGFVKVEEGK